MPDKNNYAWCVPCGLVVLVLLIWWLMPAQKSGCARPCQHQSVQLMETPEDASPIENPTYNKNNKEGRDEIRRNILRANMLNQGSGPSLMSEEFDDTTGTGRKISPQLATYIKTSATEQDIFDMAIMQRPKTVVDTGVKLDAARNGVDY